MTLAQGSWPTYTVSALDSVRREQREVERECQSFKRFRQRIQTVETQTLRFERSVVGMNQNLTSEEKPVRDTIELWYRDTVIAVGHYNYVYADSFEASISAEFGVDVLVLISEATTFSPLIKQRLLEAAQQCIDNRRVFLETLEDEFNTLKDAQSTVQEIREAIAEFDSTELQGISDTELTDRYDTLHTLNDECKSWIQQRQEEIHTHRIDRSADVDAYTDLCSYLYEDLEVDYPVLATFVDISEIISHMSSSLFHFLLSRQCRFPANYFVNGFAYPVTTVHMEFDFVRSVAPLVVIVAAAAMALTTVMTSSTVFMMVLPSMIVFSVIAFFFGMKHGEFRASP